MSLKKKNIRENFRNSVFTRDKFCCRKCGCSGHLDAHHIVDRTELPNGGYVLENGISLCEKCHRLAEKYHESGIAHPTYSPADLYLIIGSSYGKAFEASKRFGG